MANDVLGAYIGAKLEKDWRLEIRIRDFFLFRVFFVSESGGRGKKTKKSCARIGAALK